MAKTVETFRRQVEIIYTKDSDKGSLSEDCFGSHIVEATEFNFLRIKLLIIEYKLSLSLDWKDEVI